MSFFDELRRRSVFKVGVTYIIAGWIIIQVADTLLPTYGAPPWIMPVFTTIILLGFPLALALAWALEVTPKGIKITVDEDTVKGSPSGLLLNFIIMGVMAFVILWLMFDRNRLPGGFAGTITNTDAIQQERVAPTEVTTRLSNSIAVLPFENLSPDPNNAYFAAGIHDTVLLELSKIRDMNVISRTSVLPYADSNKSIEEIAKELNVETVMEGSVQYAEGQVRITAQLINPRTDSHIWSGNFDRPFSDVFRIQSDIAQSIARAIGATLLPEELESISRQQTDSEEALALYLQAKALTPNIAPSMEPIAREDLQAAIALDPDFAEPYAVLAFHYALTLGSYDPDLSMREREILAREYAQTALRLNPDLGLAHGALGILEGAHFNTRQEWDYWEQALALSPNDPDVLDDAIRSFATKGKVDRALELAEKISEINPDAMLTIQEWLAFGTGNFKPYLDLIPKQIEQISTDIREFFTILQAIFEAVEGNAGVASRIMDELNAASIPVTSFFYTYLPYANGKLGRTEQAKQQYEAYVKFFGEQSLNNTINGVYLSLAIQDETTALDIMRRLAVDPGPENGIDTMFFIMYKNFFKDPVLEKPEFLEVRRQFEARLDQQ